VEETDSLQIENADSRRLSPDRPYMSYRAPLWRGRRPTTQAKLRIRFARYVDEFERYIEHRQAAA
jgi:hypothetical protein